MSLQTGPVVQSMKREMRRILDTDDAMDAVASAFIEALKEQGDPTGVLAQLDEGEDAEYCATRDALMKSALYWLYLDY